MGPKKLPRSFSHLSILRGGGPQTPRGGKNGTDPRQSRKGPATGGAGWKMRMNCGYWQPLRRAQGQGFACEVSAGPIGHNPGRAAFPAPRVLN